MYKMTLLTSIFGGTSVCWGIPWWDVDSSAGCLFLGVNCVYYGLKASISAKNHKCSLTGRSACWKHLQLFSGVY